MREVVEFFGIDFGEFASREFADQKAQGACGGLGGVRPAGEGDQHCGQLDLRAFTFNQAVHTRLLLAS